MTPLEREKDLISSYSKEKSETQTQTQTQTQTKKRKEKEIKGHEMTPPNKTRRSHAQFALSKAMPEKEDRSRGQIEGCR